MKCIHCSTDNNYKDRNSGSRSKCKQCHHPFAFEPKTDALQMSDTMFERAIKDVSANDTLSFTSKQLWYELNRRLLTRKTLSCGAPAAVLLGVALLHCLPHFAVALIALPCILMAAAAPKKRKMTGPQLPKLPYDKFESTYLQKWVMAHGKIARLLPAVSSSKAAIADALPPGASFPSAQGAHPEAASYSFDRALVVDHAETAAMLVANHFHFENNCAILSLDGYPYGATPTIMTMLARNPSLQVFALHDACIEGCSMARQLRSADWFPNPFIRIIDLGMRPAHILKSNLIALRNAPRRFPVGTTSASITAEEIAWLEAGGAAELDTLRPHKLMRAVYQGFAKYGQAAQGEIDDDGVVIVDSGPSIWVYDSGADVYAADSFG